MNEEDYGRGARKINPIIRSIHKTLRKKVGRAPVPFDWEKGYDVRDIIGEIEIKDQGSSSSCGGQAAAYFLEVQRCIRGIKEGPVSAKSVYAPIAYPGGGTTVQALMQQIATSGGNLETSVPSYFITGEPLSESMMIEKSWMTDRTSKDALMRAGFVPFDIGEDMEDIACAIRDFNGALWEIKGQNNGTWLTANPKPPVKKTWFSTAPDPWYHFMFLGAAKIIDGKKTIIGWQSWGKKVGNRGIQNFTQDYFDAKGIVDAFTFIFGGKITPEESNKNVWAEIIRWFKRQSWFGK